MSMLPFTIELISDYLDYPNMFANLPFDNTFAMDDGQLTICSKSDKKDYIRASMSNRKYEKNEKATTPAGTFGAAEITLNLKVYTHKTTTKKE